MLWNCHKPKKFKNSRKKGTKKKANSNTKSSVMTVLVIIVAKKINISYLVTIVRNFSTSNVSSIFQWNPRMLINICYIAENAKKDTETEEKEKSRVFNWYLNSLVMSLCWKWSKFRWEREMKIFQLLLLTIFEISFRIENRILWLDKMTLRLKWVTLFFQNN